MQCRSPKFNYGSSAKQACWGSLWKSMVAEAKPPSIAGTQRSRRVSGEDDRSSWTVPSVSGAGSDVGQQEVPDRWKMRPWNEKSFSPRMTRRRCETNVPHGNRVTRPGRRKRAQGFMQQTSQLMPRPAILTMGRSAFHQDACHSALHLPSPCPPPTLLFFSPCPSRLPIFSVFRFAETHTPSVCAFSTTFEAITVAAGIDASFRAT